MSQTLDLWPDDLGPAGNIPTPPVVILREQGAILGQKTQNIVEGVVQSSSSSTEFTHQFYLNAPALGQYRYLLFTLVHPISFYPLRIAGQFTGNVVVSSQEEFIEALRGLFSLDQVKSVIQALIAQSQQAV
jgi:hypothetical protein